MNGPAPLSGGDARTQLAEGAEVAAAWLFDFTMRRTNVAARWSDAEIGAGAISDGALRRAWHYEAERLLDALLPVVERIADERAAEALRPFEDLFSGGPDTACRTTWREAPIEERAEGIPPAECVEVPMDDLRDAFTRAASLRAASRAEYLTGLPGASREVGR